MQQVRDGNYEIRNEDGALASTQTVCAVSHGSQWVHIYGHDMLLDEYLDRGYTFTPLLAMTLERVGALMSAYMYLFDENGDAWSGSESVAEILHAMILEITGKEPEL